VGGIGRAGLFSSEMDIVRTGNLHTLFNTDHCIKKSKGLQVIIKEFSEKLSPKPWSILEPCMEP